MKKENRELLAKLADNFMTAANLLHGVAQSSLSDALLSMDVDKAQVLAEVALEALNDKRDILFDD